MATAEFFLAFPFFEIFVSMASWKGKASVGHLCVRSSCHVCEHNLPVCKGTERAMENN